jgi:hypothetical protein
MMKSYEELIGYQKSYKLDLQPMNLRSLFRWLETQLALSWDLKYVGSLPKNGCRRGNTLQSTHQSWL